MVKRERSVERGRSSARREKSRSRSRGVRHTRDMPRFHEATKVAMSSLTVNNSCDNLPFPTGTKMSLIGFSRADFESGSGGMGPFLLLDYCEKPEELVVKFSDNQKFCLDFSSVLKGYYIKETHLFCCLTSGDLKKMGYHDYSKQCKRWFEDNLELEIGL